MADQVLSQSSYFALLPVLPLLLTLKFGSTQERLIAGSVSVLTLMTRGGALFLASPLHRLSVRSCVRIALTLISVSYAVVALTANPYAIIAALGAAGLGFSVNGTGVRSFIALATPDRASQNRGFAVIQVVANCTAAVGPILGNMILDRNIYEQFLLGVSVALFIAAILAPMAAPKGVMMSEGSLRPPMGIKIFRELFRTADARKITIIALIGSILIGQFFSSFSLVFSAIATSSMMRSLFYTTNGVLVVLIQIPHLSQKPFRQPIRVNHQYGPVSATNKHHLDYPPRAIKSDRGPPHRLNILITPTHPSRPRRKRPTSVKTPQIIGLDTFGPFNFNTAHTNTETLHTAIKQHIQTTLETAACH